MDNIQFNNDYKMCLHLTFEIKLCNRISFLNILVEIKYCKITIVKTGFINIRH